MEDPATGEVIATLASATRADAGAAMDAAANSQESWACTPARVRSEILRRGFERAEDLTLLMTLEMGKPLAEAAGEVKYWGEFLRWFAEASA